MAVVDGATEQETLLGHPAAREQRPDALVHDRRPRRAEVARSVLYGEGAGKRNSGCLLGMSVWPNLMNDGRRDGRRRRP